MDTIRALFFPKSGHFFRFSKSAEETSTPVSVPEFASISLIMPNYPWTCLKRLFWLCHGSEYAWSTCMFDRLLRIALVLNKPGFSIWHACMVTQGLRWLSSMYDYSSISWGSEFSSFKSEFSKSSYEIELRKISSHLELLIRKFFKSSSFELLTWLRNTLNFTSSY